MEFLNLCKFSLPIHQLFLYVVELVFLKSLFDKYCAFCPLSIKKPHSFSDVLVIDFFS